MDLKGKAINFLGDSITCGVGVSDVENNRFDNIICREHGLRLRNNYGEGHKLLAKLLGDFLLAL